MYHTQGKKIKFEKSKKTEIHIIFLYNGKREGQNSMLIGVCSFNQQSFRFAISIT
jgi:hypothetical protein